MQRHVRHLFSAIAIGVTLLVALAPSMAFGQPAKRAISLDDLSKFKSVGDPQRSPDGKWVAYVVGTIDVEKDKRDSDLWMVSWDGTQTLRLTSGPDSESSPRWSPDGRYLAFLASRGTEDEKKKGSQIWLLDRLGGEAQKLTEIEGGVSDYSWSPDSKKFVFTKGDKDPADEPEKMEGWKRKTAPPIVLDRYHFKQDREGYLKRFYNHVYVFDIAGKKLEQITTGRFEDSSPAWSPDGTKIAFVSTRQGPDPDRHQNSDLYVVDAKAGAEPRQLTTYIGGDGGRPSWSADGQWIAYYQGDETKYNPYEINKLTIIPAAGGTAKVLTEALDRPVSGQIWWSPDGKTLTFAVGDDRIEYVGRTTTAGGAVEKLTTGRRTVSNVSLGADGNLTLLAGSTSQTPEVHALEGGTLRKLTKVNDDLLAQLQLATTEDFTSKSKDGTVVNGLIVKPASYTPGKKYPTLLIIHGGPNGQDDHSFTFDNEFFAANGYVVLNINYRGSSGRGSVYQKAIYADWGNKEVMDLRRRGGPGRGGGHRRPGPPRHRRLELRRHPDQLQHRERHPLQGRCERCRQFAPVHDVWPRSVHRAVGHRGWPAVEGTGPLHQAVLPVLARGPDQDAHALHGRRKGLQRAHRRRGADVSGAQEPGRRDATGDLPWAVPRSDGPELSARSARAVPGLVRQVPEAIGSVTARDVATRARPWPAVRRRRRVPRPLRGTRAAWRPVAR